MPRNRGYFHVMVPLVAFFLSYVPVIQAGYGAQSCCLTLAQNLVGSVFFEGQKQYADSLGSYYSGQESDLSPSCIVRPINAAQVSTAVKILSTAHIAKPGSCNFAVRGGGHTPYAGSANVESGVTLDLGRMKSIKVNKSRGTVSLEPGLLWGEVYSKLDPMHISVVGGRSNLVGVAGLATGGGISFFSGRYGLVCDNILNYEVVLADGRIINANEREHVDLRNALRGGSNNFGIVTKFELSSFQQGNLWGGDITHDFNTLPEQLQAFVDYGGNSDFDEYSAFFQVFGTVGGLYFITNNPVYTKPTPYPPIFKKFYEISPQLSNTARIAPLHNLTTITGSVAAMGLRNMFITTSFDNDLPFLHWVVQTWKTFSAELAMVPGLVNTILNQHLVPKTLRKAEARGGNSLGLDPNRVVVIAMLSLTWTEAADDEKVRLAAIAFIKSVEAEAKKRRVYNRFIYLNYADLGQEVIEGYGKSQKNRLRAVSKKYDPAGVFQVAVPGGFKLWP
ncbi:putative oxidoreductase [Aaosphaeria arxii CBS 175.79]|uniref:Putative oxidoreductase n=1 Tax=Aaosphaeria arxii CBS 175.79 TaxID=1450172 RepID=A0A6A5X8G1_9PLEO|nr:putative oxidoreductase [Aaosphaeria arxii CBS 175.79]KAF2009044.1 putative oxidoreductase [Aaosphaeria arxii CBS 175.79]